MLTYVAYSDELEIEKGKYHSLPMQKLKTITRKNRKPRSRTELEKKLAGRVF